MKKHSARFELHSADRAFSVAYTNVAGYNCGYTITTPNGSTIRRIVERDEFRRSLVTNCATCFNSSLVDSNAYAFDALARPTTRRTGTTGVSSVDAYFAYNNRSEVVSAAIGSNLYGYAYDDIGNHVLFSDNATTNTFMHNALNQMVGRDAPIAPPTTFAYTPDGGLSFDGTWNYSYDAEDQLASITSSSLTNGAIRVQNSYDYRHRRISKMVQRLSVTVLPPPSPPVEAYEWNTIECRTFAYDGWNLIHETVAAIDGGTTNVSEVQYFWGLDLSDTLQGAGGVGGLLAVSCSGQFYFPTFDNNGNVTKYIDESGNVVAAYEYDDFGRVIAQSGPLADFFRHRFSTKYFDAETGLYYYVRRFYLPDWSIWINRDPIEEDGGVNLYAFCKNNAINAYDVDGCAYFAYRPLEAPIIGRRIGIHGRNRLNEHDNKVMAHEQLVFEDNGETINIGYGSDGMIQNEDMTGYVPKEKSGYYNDCIMHKAVANVKPKPYSMLSWGSSIAILNRFTPVQYNCQDYADDLRREYDRLVKDPCERKKCGLK